MADLYEGLQVSPTDKPPAAPRAPAGLYDGLELAPAATAPMAREATGLVESVQAGLQGSAPGLAWRGRMPDLVMNPETSKWWERAAASFAHVGAELPLMIGGAVAGAPLGAPAGPVGSLLAAGFGMGVVPATIRQSLIEAYKSGEIKTSADWFNAAREVATQALKEGGINAAAMGMGALAKAGIATAGGASAATAKAIGVGTATPLTRAGAAGSEVADLATQIATMVAMPAALEQRMPGMQEFIDAAILVGGLKGAHVAAKRMMTVYEKTGKTPAEQVADAQADPKTAAELAETTGTTDGVPLRLDRLIAEAETLGRGGVQEAPKVRDLIREALVPRGTETSSGVPIQFDKLIAAAEQLGRGGVPEAPRVATIIREIKERGPYQGDMLTEASDLVADTIRLSELQKRAAGEPARTDILPDGVKVEVPAKPGEKLAAPERAELEGLRARMADLEARVQALPTRQMTTESAQRVYDDVVRQVRDADQARRDSGLAPLGDDHAAAVAALVRSRVRTRAARLGVLPEAIYNERPLQIRDETAAAVAAEEAGIPAVAARFALPEVDIFGMPIEEPRVPRLAVEGMATVEVPLAGLSLSKDVPQFKGAAAADNGVVVALGGRFDRTGVGPIQVWERLDGSLEVISGRHRLDLARRSGEETIPSQVHREADGFDAKQAAMLDAMLNIREEQGSTADYVQFFQGTGITREAADAEGLLARAKGRNAFAISQSGTPDLVAAHRAGLLSDDAALALSVAAPGDARLQALGMQEVTTGAKSILMAVNTMKAVGVMVGERAARGDQGDIFGFDDSGMQEAATMAKRAVSIQRAIGEKIAAVAGAAKRPELAKKMGVDVADPAGIQKKIIELRQEQALWDNWPTHPELVARLRAPEVTGREGDLAQGPVSDSIPLESGPLKGVSREQFLGAPRITKRANAADLKPSEIKPLKEVERIPFKQSEYGDRFEAKFDDSGSAVFEGKKVIASYNFGDTLVVDKKYRRLGIAEELVYQWRTRNPEAKPASDRTDLAQTIQEKVWDRIQTEAAHNVLRQEPFVLKAETPAELKARDDEAAAQAKRILAQEAAAERLAQGKPVNVDQADLFNTQGTLFQSARAAQFDTPAFKNWFGDSKVVGADGVPLTVFHGTARPDRIGVRFRKDRATSGPMAFFTDDPKIASNYAKGKPDTSLSGEESAYENYFLYKPKGARTQRSIVQKWWELTPEQRSKFNEVMPRLRENEETGKLEDGGSDGGMAGPGTYEQYLKESRGNGIKAAIDLWLSSGAMFDREEGFLGVMKMAGIDMKGVEYIPQGRSMDAVYPVHLAIRKPLDSETIPAEVVVALEQSSKRARASRALDSGDPWDKRRRFTPAEWVSTLKEDIAAGKNSFVWTSIPDWVTKTLQRLGYDGIRDTGGKMGGEGHDVWIPFEESQVKSAIGNRGTFDPASPNILRQDARGSYGIAENLIKTLQGADKSTVVHELGHSWLEEMKLDAGREGAPEQLRQDYEIIRRELGIGEGAEIPRAAHEQFARSVERYLAEGDAPSLELRTVFERFREWLLDIYRDLRNLNVTINPEMKEVLDRMLATDEEIAAARDLGVPRAYVAEAAAQEGRKIVPGFKAEQISMEPYADELPKGPGAAPDDSHINYAYINSPTDVKLTMQRMAEIDQANIQKQRGGTDGVKSWAEANAEQAKYVNDILGGSEDTLRVLSPRDPDAPGPDVKLGILKKLAVGAAKDSARLRDVVLAAGHDATVRDQLEYMGSIERARMIQAEFLGERAGVARALNALKDVTEGSGEISKMLDAIGYGEAAARTMFQEPRTPDIEQAMLRRKLDEILLNYKGKSVLDIARLHKEIGTLKGTYKFAAEVTKATKWEMVVEGWKAGLLSGPVTHTTNLFGTGAFQALRAPVDALAAVIGMARGASPGMGESDRASMSEALARVTGMLGGVKDGVQVAVATFRLDDPTGKTEAYRTAIPGRAGELIRIPLRMMGAEDALVTTMYKRGEMRTLAIRQAFDEEMNPGTREFAARVDQLIDQPTAEMAAEAEAAATRMTFNAPLGEKGVALQLFVNKWNLQWMVPFIRTPINITKEVARMSPFAPLVGEWRADIAKGGVARDRALAEAALGSGLMALTVAYTFSGNISGGGSPDPGKNRGKAGVEQPYSIKVGDKWYEYARIQPTGTLMGLAADMAVVWDHMSDEEKDKVPKLLARAFSNAVTNQTFLQGITNVVQAMSEPVRFGPKFLQQLAGSMVPNVIGQPTAMADPVVREVNGMLESIQSRIPGLRQDLLPKRDWLGEPVESKERVAGVAPVRVQPISEDKVRLEAARLDISMAAPPKKTHIGKGTGKLGDVELTPEERNTFQKVGGEVAHRILTNIVTSEGYDVIPDLIKRRIFAKVLTASHQIAAVAALPPDKRVAHLQSISEKVAAELTGASEQ